MASKIFRSRWRRAAKLVAGCATVVLAQCGGSSPRDAVVQVTERVIAEQPARLGVNIGASTYYNDQQLAANPFSHGGFAMGRQVLVIRVTQATADTVTDTSHLPDDPDRIVESFAGGRYCIATGARAGETGTIVAHDLEAGRFTLEHAGVPLEEEELVWLHGPVVSRATPDPKEGEPGIGIGDFRRAVGPGVTLDFVPSDARAGDQHMRLRFPATDERISGGVKHYLRATPDTAYRVHIRARGEIPGARLGILFKNYAFEHTEAGATTAMTCGAPELGPEWRDYVFSGLTTSDPRIGEKFSECLIGVAVPAGSEGGAVYIDSIALEDGMLASSSGFNRLLVERLKEARCGVLRFYGSAGLGSLVESFTAANATEASWSFLGLGAFYRFATTSAVLDEWMRLSEEVGAAPWITVGGGNMPDDWHALISYLAAPATFDEHAARRAAHGFGGPWTDRFSTIYLEIGNEWWNRIFRPFHTHVAEKYGELCNTVLARVRAHPHFDPSKIVIVVGGWAINAHHWNTRLDKTVEGPVILSIAPYLLHELNQWASIEEQFAALFADVDAYARHLGPRTIDGLRANSKGTKLAAYELNTHVTGGAAPPEAASAICPSLGAGVAVLDQAMALMRDMGASPISYFTALQRVYNGRVGLWGTFVRDRSGALRPRPVWEGLRLANGFLIEGDMTAVEVTGGATWDQVENGSVPAMKAVPCLHAYAFLSRDAATGKRRLNLLLINRHLSQWQHPTVTLPFTPRATAKRVLLGGGAITDHNEEEMRIAIEESEAEGMARTVSLPVPPFSAVVHQFIEE
ncbi:MAG TPA: hypothetical protein PKI11_04325 [Candidatus Hydrogenedentes bacterium]|nr:hypothetical protein [Candidatus Hydrogenedentota bacterium]